MSPTLRSFPFEKKYKALSKQKYKENHTKELCIDYFLLTILVKIIRFFRYANTHTLIHRRWGISHTNLKDQE